MALIKTKNIDGESFNWKNFFNDNKITKYDANKIIPELKSKGIDNILLMNKNNVNELKNYLSNISLDFLGIKRFIKGLNALKNNSNNNITSNNSNESNNDNNIATNKSQIILSEKENKAMMELQKREVFVANLIRNINIEVNNLDKKGNECVNILNKKFNDIISGINERQINIMNNDFNRIKKEKNVMLKQQLNGLNVYSKDCAKYKKLYENFIHTNNNIKKKEIIKGINDLLYNDPNGKMVFITKPEMGFNINDKQLNILYNGFFVDSFDMPYKIKIEILKIKSYEFSIKYMTDVDVIMDNDPKNSVDIFEIYYFKSKTQKKKDKKKSSNHTDTDSDSESKNDTDSDTESSDSDSDTDSDSDSNSDSNSDSKSSDSNSDSDSRSDSIKKKKKQKKKKSNKSQHRLSVELLDVAHMDIARYSDDALFDEMSQYSEVMIQPNENIIKPKKKKKKSKKKKHKKKKKKKKKKKVKIKKEELIEVIKYDDFNENDIKWKIINIDKPKKKKQYQKYVFNSDEHKIKHSTEYIIKIRGKNKFGFGPFSDIYKINTRKYSYQTVWSQANRTGGITISDKNLRAINSSGDQAVRTEKPVPKGEISCFFIELVYGYIIFIYYVIILGIFNQYNAPNSDCDWCGLIAETSFQPSNPLSGPTCGIGIQGMRGYNTGQYNKGFGCLNPGQTHQIKFICDYTKKKHMDGI